MRKRKENKARELGLRYAQSVAELSESQLALLQDLAETYKRQQAIYAEIGKVAIELGKITNQVTE